MKKIIYWAFSILLLLQVSACANNHSTLAGRIIAYSGDIQRPTLRNYQLAKTQYEDVILQRFIRGMSVIPRSGEILFASNGGLFMLDKELEEKEIYSENDVFGYPVVSPDGSDFVFAKIHDDGSQLLIYHAETKTATSFCISQDASEIPEDWIEGSILARSFSNEDDEAIVRIDPISCRREVLLIAQDNERLFHPRFSPNGKFIVMEIRSSSLADDQSVISLFSLSDNEVIDLWVIPSPSYSPVWSPDGKSIAYIHENQVFTYNIDQHTIDKIDMPQGNYIYLQWVNDASGE